MFNNTKKILEQLKWNITSEMSGGYIPPHRILSGKCQYRSGSKIGVVD